MIYIRERAVYDVLKNMIGQDRGFSFLVADDSYILSYPDPGKAGTTIFDTNVFQADKGNAFKETVYDGRRSIIASYPLQGGLRKLGLNWKVISVISDEKLLENVNKIKSYSLLLQIAAIGLTALISLYVSGGIIKPIRRLNQKINRYSGASDTVRPFRNRKDELWVLESSFNEMVVRIGELIERNNEEKDRQREMELIALQAQINPHFLYNTLDAIGWLAKIHKQEEIERMVIALSHFYRLSLHKGDKFISVEEEIGIVKSYVAIEAMRFPQKFEVEYDIAEDILDFKVLKIIVQPLVENAIKHGVSQKRGKGRITVKGYRSGRDLKIEVADDGAGFDVGTLNGTIEPPAYKGGGYGIRNVSERIRLEYGDGYGVEIRSVIGEGTVSVVTVKIKFEQPL
ncbi:sensor histidine kinase [Gordoniibacillus kamchatkensis]|uniref:sensor histidine kinase n=1 Tax=Gordoniibacillus kamchatkensis TaxID=1590651 RepID=UPI0006991AB8|nr:histidine kinase [Paenibacillus sp. VKM B-2647]